MNKKVIALIVVAVVVVALVAAGLVILMGHQAGTPASNQNPSTGISIDQATTAVQTYLGKMGYSNLGIGTMQEYSNMYYAQVVEQTNGTGAFELMLSIRLQESCHLCKDQQ